MHYSSRETLPTGSKLQRLLAYVADLELEVDRLRRHNHLIHQETKRAVSRVRELCTEAGAPERAVAAVAGIGGVADELANVLQDLREPPGYHPSHDEVVAIAIRPLAEQVFRWQQRLVGAPEASLRLDLQTEYVEWFPARLRHILDNLISNALKYRDPDKSETLVVVAVRDLPSGFELRVSDNGIGIPFSPDRDQVFDLFYRAAPARAAGLGVGLAVVKLLVEQSGGTLTVNSRHADGTTFIALLPRYDVDDFLV